MVTYNLYTPIACMNTLYWHKMLALLDFNRYSEYGRVGMGTSYMWENVVTSLRSLYVGKTKHL